MNHKSKEELGVVAQSLRNNIFSSSEGIESMGELLSYGHSYHKQSPPVVIHPVEKPVKKQNG